MHGPACLQLRIASHLGAHHPVPATALLRAMRAPWAARAYTLAAQIQSRKRAAPARLLQLAVQMPQATPAQVGHQSAVVGQPHSAFQRSTSTVWEWNLMCTSPAARSHTSSRLEAVKEKSFSFAVTMQVVRQSRPRKQKRTRRGTTARKPRRKKGSRAKKPRRGRRPKR